MMIDNIYNNINLDWRVWSSIVLFVVAPVGFVWLKSLRNRGILSNTVWKKNLAMAFKPWLYWICILYCYGVVWAPANLWDSFYDNDPIDNKLICLGFVAVACILIFMFLHFLKKPYKIHQPEGKDSIDDMFNFLIQTSVIVVSCVFVILVICILHIDSKSFLALGIIGFAASILFKDVFAGIASFYHLRAMKLLRIGDWIQIPEKGVDGIIIDVSLAMVKVENWDTTISSLPTSVLMNEHLKNNGIMLRGETPGRRMTKQFLIDVDSIKTLSQQELDEIYRKMDEVSPDVMKKDAIPAPVLNIVVFREYISHWLCHNPTISQLPRMMVRIMEHTSEGLAIEVYTYLKTRELMEFERNQTEIIEFIISSMDIFGIKLFQRPTAEVLRERGL